MYFDDRLRSCLNMIGTYLRLHFGDTHVSGSTPTPGGDAFRFDIQEGTGSYRLWVRYDIQWVAENDIAALLGRRNIVMKLREAGPTGSVVLNKEGAFVSGERKPPDLGD